MKISEFSVKHSLLVNLISVFILIAGFATIFVLHIRREAFPEVSFDMVIVQSVYPGAAPPEVEKLVTVPLETELKGVDGIETMVSSSIDNLSTIQLDINQDVKDKDKVVDDVKQAVDMVTDLPENVEEPVVTEITSGEIPIVKIALSGQLSEEKLQDIAERLEDELEDIAGVSSISRTGWRDREVWIEIDPQKLREVHVSLNEVMSALGRRNVSIPAGKIRGREEITVRTTGEFYTKEEIEDVIIRANDLGNWLRIKDIADVRFTFEDEDIINKSMGTRSITLTVIKRSSGDAVTIVDEAIETTEKFLNKENEAVTATYIDDISYYIKRRLGVLKNNGIVGFILVVCVLMIFLKRSAAILTALGIPIAIATTLVIMGVIDISVNLISMFGLIIVLGMLVDDGIIVAENCSRYVEKGYSPRDAAIKGTDEVVKPVITAVLTTIATFFPLFFFPGMMGKFLRNIPAVVIIALVASLLEALVILPSHFADFVKIPKNKKVKSKKELPWFNRIVNFYTKVLKKALNKRYWVIGGLIVTLIATFLLAFRMDFVLFYSEEGIEQFYIRAEAPVGTTLKETNKLVTQVEEIVSEMPDYQLDSYTTQVGMLGQGWMFDEYGKNSSHTAQVTVYLTPFTERSKNVSDIIDELRPKMNSVKGFDNLYFEKEQEGPPVGMPIAVEIRGNEFSTLNEIAASIMAYLNGIDGVSDVQNTHETGRKQIQVIVDEKAAASSYVTIEDIASTIRFVFKGGVATTIKPTKAEEEIDVVVRFPEELRDDASIFDKIAIPNSYGHLIPLKKVARLEEKDATSIIRHLDGKRVITVRANVDNDKITSVEANRLLAAEFAGVEDKYPGYEITYGGEQEENEDVLRYFVIAFTLSLFLIFMILAATFNSMVQPFIVMMAIPFGLIGVIWAFFLHGLPLGFFMLVGFIGLVGIVVNDSIILVEFINNLRREGSDRRNSIIEGGQLRLRPVILTTVTTVFGLVPVAYGIGGGDPFLKPLALTIVWGIMCATALTLIVIPCIYAIVDDMWAKVAGHSTVKESGDGFSGFLTFFNR
jgi:multidrug efflux pump subunit AcrB